MNSQKGRKYIKYINYIGGTDFPRTPFLVTAVKGFIWIYLELGYYTRSYLSLKRTRFARYR